MCRWIGGRGRVVVGNESTYLLMMMIEEEWEDEQKSVNAQNVTPISFVLSSPSDLLTTLTIHTAIPSSHKCLLPNTLQRAMLFCVRVIKLPSERSVYF